MDKEKKTGLDMLFDAAERIVDGAAAVLKDVPDPDGEEYAPTVDKRVIDVPVDSKPLLKSSEEIPVGNRKQPREVVLSIKNVSKRQRGGVTIIAETATHEVVAILLSAEDWKKVFDAADWMRMVPD